VAEAWLFLERFQRVIIYHPLPKHAVGEQNEAEPVEKYRNHQDQLSQLVFEVTLVEVGRQIVAADHQTSRYHRDLPPKCLIFKSIFKLLFSLLINILLRLS
jgi:hypothetical protein